MDARSSEHEREHGIASFAADDTAASLLGADRQHLLGRRLTSIIIPDEREHWHRFLGDTLVHRGSQAGRVVARSPMVP